MYSLPRNAFDEKALSRALLFARFKPAWTASCVPTGGKGDKGSHQRTKSKRMSGMWIDLIKGVMAVSWRMHLSKLLSRSSR